MRWSGLLLVGLLGLACEPAPSGEDPAGDAMASDAVAADVMASDAIADDMGETTPDAFERVIDRGLPPTDGGEPEPAPDLGDDPGPVGGERCNGVDDDGDGIADEGMGLGAPCAVGRGACAAPGIVDCQGGRAVCLGEPGAPGVEVCDGIDDDCDGIVDEDLPERACYPGPARTDGVGACRPGRTGCIAGSPVCLDGVLPAPEACDGADRDCDGRVDEGCAGCGDGVIGPGEACDDGGQVAGDGCAADCTLEGVATGLVPGIQRDVSLAEVAARGWLPCHISDYRTGGEPLDDVLDGCRGSHLLMGCARQGADVLTVAAEGLFEQVTADVGGGARAVNSHNGVDFYFSRAASWGFAPPGAGVNRNTCDVQDEASPERLCWHTADDAFRGGWRCGAAVRLNDSADWQRVIFTRDQVALGDGRGFGHHGICGDFNGCVDAAGCAAAACAYYGQGRPLGWRSGLCGEVPGLDCDLFERLPDALDDDWLPGCDMPVAYDVVCAAGAPLICGDGRLDPGEGCDDGGRAAGDGCSPTCEIEAPLERFAGPRVEVPIGDLRLGGFDVCHTETYDTVIDVAGVRADCPGEDWVVGCRPVGEAAVLTVAAMGEQAVIFDPVAGEPGAARDHNGARWYYTDDYSFGFAPVGADLARNVCDTAGDVPELRLCWHTIDRGGWRCGATTGLNDSADWERVVLHRRR